jgi:hypothetical protein
MTATIQRRMRQFVMDQHRPLVFLDVSVRKHAIRRRERLYPIPGTSVYRIEERDPTRIVTGQLRDEIDAISAVASLARAGAIKLASNLETTLELLTIVSIPSPGKSEFHDINIANVPAPFEYSRLASGTHYVSGTAKELQYAFLRRIRAPRFLEIQRACGAYQGDSVAPNGNQLADAFHIWCAEVAAAEYFLTTDLKLVRVVRQYKKAPLRVSVVSPTQLLVALETNPSSAG